MKIELVIRGKVGRDLSRFLLDVAAEMELPPAVIRMTPEGIFIPMELADRAGFLDEFKKAPEPEKVEVADDKPKRTTSTRGRKSKSSAAQANPEEESNAADDPWG